MMKKIGYVLICLVLFAHANTVFAQCRRTEKAINSHHVQKTGSGNFYVQRGRDVIDLSDADEVASELDAGSRHDVFQNGVNAGWQAIILEDGTYLLVERGAAVPTLTGQTEPAAKKSCRGRDQD